MTIEEEKILREVAAWFPHARTVMLRMGHIFSEHNFYKNHYFHPFGDKYEGSKAYEVLAPILEKYGVINLNDYRRTP